jgi:hypothetical protein
VVQHLNPAVRAARTCPELGVSRLLISLNDFDVIPVGVIGTDRPKLKWYYNLSGVISDWLDFLFVNAVTPFTSLSKFFRDMAIYIVWCVCIPSVCLFYIVVILESYAMPVIVGFIVLGLIHVALKVYAWYRARQDAELALEREMDALDLPKTMGLARKMEMVQEARDKKKRAEDAAIEKIKHLTPLFNDLIVKRDCMPLQRKIKHKPQGKEKKIEQSPRQENEMKANRPKTPEENRFNIAEKYDPYALARPKSRQTVEEDLSPSLLAKMKPKLLAGGKLEPLSHTSKVGIEPGEGNIIILTVSPNPSS